MISIVVSKQDKLKESLEQLLSFCPMQDDNNTMLEYSFISDTGIETRLSLSTQDISSSALKISLIFSDIVLLTQELMWVDIQPEEVDMETVCEKIRRWFNANSVEIGEYCQEVTPRYCVAKYLMKKFMDTYAKSDYARLCNLSSELVCVTDNSICLSVLLRIDRFVSCSSEATGYAKQRYAKSFFASELSPDNLEQVMHRLENTIKVFMDKADSIKLIESATEDLVFIEVTE